MSPEYASQGIFSTKSDVFSFGVLMLEILSGRRNNSFYDINRPMTLVGYVSLELSLIFACVIDKNVLIFNFLNFNDTTTGMGIVVERCWARPYGSNTKRFMLDNTISKDYAYRALVCGRLSRR